MVFSRVVEGWRGCIQANYECTNKGSYTVSVIEKKTYTSVRHTICHSRVRDRYPFSTKLQHVSMRSSRG